MRQLVRQEFGCNANRANAMLQKAREKAGKIDPVLAKRAQFEMVMQFDDLYRSALANGDYNTCCQILNDKAKLLDLYAPAKTININVEQKEIIDYSRMTDDELKMLQNVIGRNLISPKQD